MRILTIILCMSFIFSGELEVEGDLKVTGNIEAGTIDSLQQTISAQQQQISELHALIASLQAQIISLQYYLGFTDCSGVPGGTAVEDPCGICNGDGTTCGLYDVEGNFYSFIEIGDQTWLDRNLMTTKYKNGDQITWENSNWDWQNSTSGAYSYYDNSYTNLNDYGILYNGYVVSDDRGVCPEGSRIPSREEFILLDQYLGDNSGGKLKETGTAYWNSPNTGATDETGFGARGAGWRHSGTGTFTNILYNSYYWTSTLANEVSFYSAYLTYNSGDLTTNQNNGYTMGQSIRCIVDE